MATQYKPTKPQKVKAAKPAKAPKAEKPVKMGAAMTVKTSKPVKAPKQPKAPKPEKAVAVKSSKVEKPVKIGADAAAKKNSSKRPVKLLVVILVILIIAAAAVFAVHKKAEHDNQIAKILVSTPPDKLQYYVGDRPRYEGLTLQVVLNNGESYVVDESECEFSGFDSSKAAERQTVTVAYQGFTSTYQITVKDVPKPAPVLGNIYLETLPKTEYKVGEWLSTDGGVLMVQYKDGSYFRHYLTNQDVYGFVTDVETETIVTEKPGTYTLEIRYREGGITKTTTYTITVTK